MVLLYHCEYNRESLENRKAKRDSLYDEVIFLQGNASTRRRQLIGKDEALALDL